ncbi:MAG: hypothetical protein JKY65_05925 [Planctomycetes bacterium]|nr:hypothetical protein [Planctomycetota bacterium]
MTKTLTTLALLTVVGAGALVLNTPNTTAQANDAPDFERNNPDLVEWQQDRTAASALATKGDRPLLVFQLLGNLDQEFC